MVDKDTVYIFRDSDLDKLNARIWYTIDELGQPLVFGDRHEKKFAKWITSNVVIEAAALDRLKRGDMPEGWLFRDQKVAKYIEQFDNRELWKGFEYTYAERLLEYEIPNPDYPKSLLGILKHYFKHGLSLPSQTIRINQMSHMCEQLKEAFATGIQSTRIVADTTQPHIDWKINDIPCLRAIQILPLPGKRVEAHLLFRSHDYGNGYGPNLAMLINAINKHVVLPAGGALTKVVLTSWVAHLYNTDEDMYRPVVDKYKKDVITHLESVGIQL